jgi:aminomethyltransferase
VNRWTITRISLRDNIAESIRHDSGPQVFKSVVPHEQGKCEIGARFAVRTEISGGYSGERGYEVFCASKDAPFIFFPFDIPHENTTPWEVRADWTVDLGKADFRGKSALAASKGEERSFITGLEVDSDDAVSPGAKVLAGGKEVGVVTSTAFSRHLMKSLALAQIAPSHTALGTPVDIDDGGKRLKGTVVRTPFYDPLRLRTHPPVRG